MKANPPKQTYLVTAKDATLEIQFQVHFKKAKSFPDLDAVRKEAVAIVFSRAHTVIGYSSTKWGISHC